MAEEKEGVTTASSEQKTREMDGKKNYGRRKLPSDTIRESEEFFEVDKIVGMTKINGKERYKVRWVGYPASNDTWEPRENLLPCIEMVEDFERDRQRLKKRRAEERRIRKSQRHDPLAMMEGRLLPGTPLPDGKILSTATTTTTTTPTPTSSLTTASYGNVSSGANPLEANDSRNLSSIGNCGLLGQPPPTTLKDTFWKDLEEGKVDLFETDMYSKVKAQGRASRPKSFKNVFNKQSERLRGNNSQSTKKSSSKGNRKQNILAKYYSQRRIRTNHIRKSSDKNQYSFGPRTENSNLVSKNCDTSLTDCANNNDSIVTEDWDYMVDRKSPMMKPCDLNRMDCDTKSSISYSTTENCKEKFMYQRNITVQLSQGCRQPNSKDSPPSLQQVDCAVNEGTESDQSSKSQIACDTSSQNCDCDNKSSPSSSPSSALRLQNLKDPTHSLAKKRRTRLRPNRNIVISYSSKRKKTKFQNIRTSPKKTMRSTMNLLPPEKSNCNIFAMGESSVDSGVSSLRTETETEMDSNSPGLESIASTVSVSRSMTPQDTGSVCLLEEDPVNSELVLMPLETSAISSCQLVLPCDIGTELKTPTDEKSGVDTRCSTKIKPCSSTPETCPETNSEIKQTIHLSQMSGYTLSDQSFGSYSNSNKASLGNPTRWEISALLKLQNPLNSIRNKIVRNFFDNCTAEELTNFCSCSSRLDRSRNIESSTPTSVKKARLSNNVIQISKDEFVQAVLAGDYERLKSALRGDRSHYDLESPNVDGYTLIMQSILRGFSDITLLLALAGAQLDKSLSSGETALMLACTRGEVAAVEVLVKLGANLEKYTSNKETALIKSIYSGNLQIVKLLLDHGANMGFQNRDNFNVLDLVCANPSLQGMQAILTMYHDKFMTQMKDCINVWLKGEHQLVEEVFPTQCMALSKGRKIQISFRHYQQECEHYEGYLLFLVHVNDIGALHIGCRLKGESVVTNVYLNGGSEKQVSLPSKFVTSFRNLKHGDNTLRIETKPDARMTLLICAYKVRRKTS